VAGLCDGTLSERATLDRLGDLAADVLDLLLDGRVLPPEPERIEQHRRVIGHLRAIASSTARRRAAR
jgi:hypothetical protein